MKHRPSGTKPYLCIPSDLGAYESSWGNESRQVDRYRSGQRASGHRRFTREGKRSPTALGPEEKFLVREYPSLPHGKRAAGHHEAPWQPLGDSHSGRARVACPTPTPLPICRPADAFRKVGYL